MPAPEVEPTREVLTAQAFEILASVIDPGHEPMHGPISVSTDEKAGHIVYAVATYTGNVVNQGQHWQALWADEYRDHALKAQEVGETLRSAAAMIRTASSAPTWAQYHKLEGENQVLRSKLRRAGIS